MPSKFLVPMVHEVPGGMEHGGISHQGVRFEEIVGNRRKEDVLGAFHIDGKLDARSGVNLLELLLEELAGILHGRNGNGGCIPRLPLELFPNATTSALGMISDLRQNPTRQVGDETMVDAHGAGVLAPLAGRTSVDRFSQFDRCARW